MKLPTLALAILAASATFSAPAGAEIQLLMSAYNQAESAASVKEAFRLAAAARNGAGIGQAIGSAAADDNREAVEIRCSPTGATVCVKDFVAACKGAKGRMSPNSNGGVTCALPRKQ